MYVYMWPKNWLLEVLPLENLSLVQSTARSSNLTTKKGAYYTRRFIQGKKFVGILLTGWEKGSRKIVFRQAMPHLHAMQLAMQYYCNCSADLIGASLSEPHIDHDNSPRAWNNGMSVSMYHLPHVGRILAPEICVRPEIPSVFPVY